MFTLFHPIFSKTHFKKGAKFVWKAKRNCRQGRTGKLTTHFLPFFGFDKFCWKSRWLWTQTRALNAAACSDDTAAVVDLLKLTFQNIILLSWLDITKIEAGRWRYIVNIINQINSKLICIKISVQKSKKCQGSNISVLHISDPSGQYI